MKKVTKILWPFLVVFLALGFMSQYKGMDTLSDKERIEIKNYVKNADDHSENGHTASDNKNGDE